MTRTRAESGFTKREFLDHGVSEQFTRQFTHPRQEGLVGRSPQFHLEALPLANATHLAESEPLFKESLELSQRVRGEDNPETIKALNNYAALLQALGQLLLVALRSSVKV